MTEEIESFAINLSNDSETEEFDLEAGQTWIYPTNYTVRDYQYNIVQQALLKNTLVSLPTGLGKTFIAAVVMYNFFRWYPQGKVIFMAPTRPLVKQQIEACYDIMAIPKDVTVELTGTKLSSSREAIWKEKRVFFITPQILQNDLDKLTALHKKIKCLVFDEAHRARGNHAYCEVIRKLLPHNKYFRVLALSATPGSNISDVLEVVKNLLISHLEFRTEENLDVRPYVFERNLTTVVVPLGEKLQQVRDDYLQILEFYTRALVDNKVIQGNCGNLTKGKIFMTLKEFQQRTQHRSANHGEIMKSLQICVTLYHGLELLTRHGLRSFLIFFDEHQDKPLLRGNTRLIRIMEDIREYLGPDPVIEQLPDGSFVEIPKDSKFGHPKFYKLRDILATHIALENESSRVIVFFEYRNSVKEAYALLNQARPLLRPRIFLGQGHGITQRKQLNVIKSFKEGECNILLSTCIGEEGLDVGDVDLIVCFDISNKSPIRMVQRMGRTGRKKEGRIIVLVTEGKEQQILKDCLIHKNNIPLQVLSSKEISKGLNTDSPRLVPPEIQPKCNKIYITIKKAPLSKKSSIKDMFRNISKKSSELQFPADLEIVDVKDRIPKQTTLWNKGSPLNKNLQMSNLFSKKLEKQRSLHRTYLVKHSQNTELLVGLLQQADSMRFNIPLTQTGSSQSTQVRNLKQGDIRNMFLKSQSSSEGTQAQNVKPTQDCTEDNVPHRSKELFTEIANFLAIETSQNKTECKLCPQNFDCNDFYIAPSVEKMAWLQPDESVFNITLKDLQIFLESKIMQSESTVTDRHDSQENMVSQIDDLDVESVMCAVAPAEKTMTYQAPKTLDFLLNKYSTSIVEVDDFMEKSQTKQQKNDSIVGTSIESYKKYVFDFFKLNSVRDFFECAKTCGGSPDIIENSFEAEKTDEEDENNISPVLRTFERPQNIRNFKKKLFRSLKPTVSVSDNTKRDKPNFKKLRVYSSSDLCDKIDTPSKFSLNIVESSSTPFHSKTQENLSTLQKNKDLSGEKHETSVLKDCNSSCKGNENTNYIDIDDLCDLSVFGLSFEKPKLAPKELNNTADNSKSTTATKSNLRLDDICDLKSFGIEVGTNQKSSYGKTNNNATEIGKVHNTDTKTNRKNLDSEKFVRPPDIPSQSQASITQLIDLINAEDLNTSRRESLSIVHSTQNSIAYLHPVVKQKAIRKKHVNPFIESEAELSINEDIDTSDDEDEDDQNLYETSFIDDNTQLTDTQMHVRYLQSTRSPRKHSKFKIPERPNRFSNVFSQEVLPDDTYLDDSFIVHDEVKEEQHELSELEILEEKLRLQKKKRKKSEDTAENVKRKRIRRLSSDDSD